MILTVDLANVSSFSADLGLSGWNSRLEGEVIRFYSNLDCNLLVNYKTWIEVNQVSVVISRSSSAEIPLFYGVVGSFLYLSDSIYELQEKLKKSLDIDVAYEYIYSQFLPKEKTLFEGLCQLLNNQKLFFSFIDGKVVKRVEDNFSLPMEEMNDSDEKSISLKLREEIAQAHKKRIGANNALFLSGGLDSQVMAITLSKDLELGSSVQGLHFHVKGAAQTELDDAKKTAMNLGIGFTAVEVDPYERIDFQSLSRMNAPYIGSVSIDNLLRKASLDAGTTVFTGQDTRLHTPSLKKIDERLLSLLYSNPILGAGLSHAAKFLLKSRNALTTNYDSNFYRKLSFFAFSGKEEQYLVNRFFHVTNLPFHSRQKQLELIARISGELTNIDLSNKRSLFNTLVKGLWRRQFLYDVNYMQSNAHQHGLILASPFYDAHLAEFSARLPFDLASKITKGRAGHGVDEVSVNKYLLRQAYKGELDNSLIFRDKAVCLTAHMFFNGGLRDILEDFINDKELVRDDRAKQLYLDEIQKLCKIKHGIWQEQDHWLMMVVFNALVVYRFLRESN
jgi:asparagine synthase (glutamine-hydrolysing)